MFRRHVGRSGRCAKWFWVTFEVPGGQGHEFGTSAARWLGAHSHLGPTRAMALTATRRIELRRRAGTYRGMHRYLQGDARMRQMQVRGMSTEYPHGGDRYLGQWGAVSWIFISRVSSVSSPFVRGAPHTSKSTKKCLCRPGGWSGWVLGGQVSCQGHPPGGGIQPPHVSWAYPSIFSRKGPVGTPDKTPKIDQKRHIAAPIANVDQL